MNGLLSDEEALRRFNAIESGDQPWYTRALPMEGRATILPFKDSMPGSVFNKREWAIPGLLAEAINAFTAPKRAYSDPEFDTGKEGVNFALNFMGGGVGGSRAMPNPTGQGGKDVAMFAGRNASTADLEALKRFNELRSQGVPSSASYRETGWMTGAEGLPKFEISDDAARALVPNPEKGQDIPRVNLGQVLEHPELYKAYPELQSYSVYLNKPTGAAGSFDPYNKVFQVDPRVLDPQNPFYSPEKAKNLLLHETQHAVQRLENFESGGNPEFARKVFEKQKNLDLGQFDPNLEYTWNSGMADLKFASNVDYAKSLDKIINSENIKPSRVTKLSDWYAYSDKIRSEYGSPPKNPGAERDEWYKNAARYIQQQTLKDQNIRTAYDTMSDKDIKSMLRSADKTLDSVRNDYFKFRESKGKYSEMKGLLNVDLYKRLAGEAEARLTETRSGMTPEQRRMKFPFQQLDVQYEQLLYPSLLD